MLFIEYAVEDMGTAKDLKKLHALEDRMNNLTGWMGVGYCDGNSIGSGTMEVFCIVADFEIAKRVIEDDLAETQFSNFTQIAEMPVGREDE